jgi:hypothetical protein
MPEHEEHLKPLKVYANKKAALEINREIKYVFMPLSKECRTIIMG